MTDQPTTPPDRLSTDPRSPHYDGEALARGVGIRFKGVERTNVEEYSIGEGWVRMAVANSRDRRGNPMTVKLAGAVEAYFRDIAGGDPDATAAGEEQGPEQAD